MNKEKVRELVELLDSEPTRRYRIVIAECWLEQNQPAPVVVGLSDEQVIEVSKYVGKVKNVMNIDTAIRVWLKTQTFAQHRAFDDSELSEKYMNLYDDYQSLLIDKANANQFEPDWDKIPKHTPAPWSIEFGIRSAVISDVATNEIAVVEIGIHDEETEAELRANAKLIAAAPDLLEALIEMIELCTFIAPDIQSNLIDNARVAIAKATL